MIAVTANNAVYNDDDGFFDSNDNNYCDDYGDDFDYKNADDVDDDDTATINLKMMQQPR